jgi:hypothetical protein
MHADALGAGAPGATATAETVVVAMGAVVDDGAPPGWEQPARSGINAERMVRRERARTVIMRSSIQ